MLKKLLSLIVLALTANMLAAQSVVLEDDGAYRIECVSHAKGGVAPGAAFNDPSVLFYVSDTNRPDALLWTISKVGEDSSGAPMFTLRHNSTGLYATYDGERNDYKRYVEMTDAPQGEGSYWTFVPQSTAYSIQNVKAPAHHWHVRTSSLTGTYAEDIPPGSNSQFWLYDSNGRRVTEIVPPAPSFSNLVHNLTIGGKPAIYDSRTETYLVTVPDELRSAKDATFAINYSTEGGNVKISGFAVESGSDFTFSNFKGGRAYNLAIRGADGNNYKSTLSFTFLPIVELFGHGFSASTHPGQIRVNDADNEGVDELLNMKVHWRGNTSIRRAKKNYAVKLTDADGKSVDRKLLGLRNDNNWILDAAFIDPSRIRNRVSTDIWNDFRTAPYYADREPKARTATRGRMVEVFLNGVYDGIYCMTEKLDRKQLKLRKLDTHEEGGVTIADPLQHGQLYKAVEWHYTSYFGYEGGSFTGVLPSEPLNTSDAWGGWEVKYPDLGDGEPFDWAPLYNHVAFMSTCTDAQFKREVANRFDLPVMRDYYLLQEMALATDNTAKNIYWFIYDAAESTKMSLAPWDFDGTWGINWNGAKSNSAAEHTLRSYFGDLLSSNKIYSYLMRLNYDGWNARLAERYCELRRTKVFDPDALYQRFDDYVTLLRESGATQREFDRWNGADGYQLDWDADMTYIRGWIDAHVATLDALYGYDPITGTIAISAFDDGHRQPVDVYSIDGRHVLHIEAQSGFEAEAQLRTLPAGVYIIGGKKVKI